MDAAARDLSLPYGLFLTSPLALEFRDLTLPPPQHGAARVRVAGCGLCYTDIGFYSGTVRTKHDLPHSLAEPERRAPQWRNA